MTFARINTAPRHKNSGRQNEGKRFPGHLAWLRGRRCIVADLPGHVCEGKIEAAHVDSAGGKGMGMKVADFHAVPICGGGHASLHKVGQRTWEARHGIKLVDAAAAYAKASPHRSKWEAAR